MDSLSVRDSEGAWNGISFNGDPVAGENKRRFQILSPQAIRLLEDANLGSNMDGSHRWKYVTGVSVVLERRGCALCSFVALTAGNSSILSQVPWTLLAPWMAMDVITGAVKP